MERTPTTEQNTRVVVADSQPKVRYALKVMLARRPGCCIVGEATHSSELLDLLSHIQPDVILLGWGSPGLDGDQLPQRVAQAAENASLIVLSERPDLGPTALAAGAQEFVCKGNPPEELLAALDRCLGYQDTE